MHTNAACARSTSRSTASRARPERSVTVSDGGCPGRTRAEPLCAAAEAMSAVRGDMRIGVIWVLPGGGARGVRCAESEPQQQQPQWHDETAEAVDDERGIAADVPGTLAAAGLVPIRCGAAGLATPPARAPGRHAAAEGARPGPLSGPWRDRRAGCAAAADLLLPSGRLPSARFHHHGQPPRRVPRGPVKRDQTAGPKSLSGPAGGFYGETVATAGPWR